ncbi:uncharacterized protein LOC129314152 [Prosopis cineraria]|uniref:uncharacterized protein LOC129314152 n=1 Tax=Prosopis cineraria TaxID=364024 RepID=UPI002410192E|nr:uncharacterized protein LOC129314152 [Prosopis cineraria]
MAKLGNEKITWIVSVVFCFFLSLVLAMATTGDGASGKEHEVERLLKKLNKPAVKSIKSPDGDIIDCVHILNRPAFDHPKLKNHKIQYAVADLRGDRYYGGHASINIYGSPLFKNPMNLVSQIWIVNDDDPINVETIEAGSQNDSYQTQCYNLNCQPGFVQVHNKVAVTSSLEPSVYYGSRNWKLVDASWGTSTGYWPASLFDRMSESASNVKWGGEIINLRSDGQHTTTGMGSGYFPEEGYGKASFFKELSIVDANNNLVSPKNFGIIVTNPYCYNITAYDYSNDSGVYFYYGGPGRNPNCP